MLYNAKMYKGSTLGVIFLLFTGTGFAMGHVCERKRQKCVTLLLEINS